MGVNTSYSLRITSKRVVVEDGMSLSWKSSGYLRVHFVHLAGEQLRHLAHYLDRTYEKKS